MSIRAVLLASLFISLASIAYPQSLNCLPTAVNPVIHAEGIAEPLGDIVMNCTGSNAGSTISLNLTVFLNVGITNRISTNNVTDVSLTVDTGSGQVPSAVPGILQNSNAVSFNGVSFTVPASRNVVLRLSNLRGNVSQFGAGSQRPVVATLSLNAGPVIITVPSDQLSVGIPVVGLLATLSDTGIRCTGSPLPDVINFNNLIARGTRFVSTRVTEGFASSFEKKTPTSDSGIRIVARYGGLPAGARLFTPDVVAGSDAVQPTAAGDLGGTTSGGSYAPGGSGSLLLVRVNGTDANGAGGTLIYAPGTPGSGTVSFNSVSEVPIANGAGIVVYEVVDSNPNARETAQFPTFLGLAPISDGSGPIASENVSLGPISTAFAASNTDPIPRFVGSTPPSDCPTLNDCNASYFPELFVEASQPLEFTAPAGSAPQTKTVQIQNHGGGVLSWTATLTGVSGSGWLTVTPSSGVNYSSVLVNVFPQNVAPGVYTGTLVIDAGPVSGSRTLPVKAIITNGPVVVVPPDLFPPKVVVENLRSAARPDSPAVAPGSLANVNGSHLKGTNVMVTFDGSPAKIVTAADDFITVQIPETLSAPQSAQLEVVVDGAKSASLPVQISEVAPAVFPTGILNENFSANSLTNPAAVGSTLQILATGLKTGGPLVVKLHDRTVTPSFIGPLTGWAGINLISAVIPADLPAMTTFFYVCGFASANPSQPVCSQASFVTLK